MFVVRNSQSVKNPANPKAMFPVLVLTLDESNEWTMNPPKRFPSVKAAEAWMQGLELPVGTYTEGDNDLLRTNVISVVEE